MVLGKWDLSKVFFQLVEDLAQESFENFWDVSL